MGWERKRGKLEELNRLLRGATDTSFTTINGTTASETEKNAEQALLRKIRYVITLGFDTQLPRDVARKLVGAAIHPLNRRSWIRAQPVRAVMASCSRALASRSSAPRDRSLPEFFSGNTGIDPYTTAVSDVYQDLFGEGNFTGKGLYDVDASKRPWRIGFRKTRCSVTIYSNRCLRAPRWLPISSCWTTTVVLRHIRETTASLDARRLANPALGLSHCPRCERSSDAKSAAVNFSLENLDNLRRSLVAPAMFLWLLAAWTVFPGSPLLWSLFIVITIAFPVYLHVTTSLLIHPRGVPWTSHFWSVWGDVRTNTAQVALSVVFLPHQAYLMTDAIVRTIYRKLVSRRSCLSGSRPPTRRKVRGAIRCFLLVHVARRVTGGPGRRTYSNFRDEQRSE